MLVEVYVYVQNITPPSFSNHLFLGYLRNMR